MLGQPVRAAEGAWRSGRHRVVRRKRPQQPKDGRPGEALVELHASRSILEIGHANVSRAPALRIGLNVIPGFAVEYRHAASPKAGRLPQSINVRLMRDPSSHIRTVAS